MRLDWAILANSAEVQGNLTYVLGGGWDTAFRPGFPTSFLGALTLRVMLHQTEVAEAHRLELRFWDADGNEFAPTVTLTLGPGQVPEEHPRGWEIPALLAINLHGLPVEHEGHYSLEIMIDGHHMKSLPFRFVEGMPPDATSALPPAE